MIYSLRIDLEYWTESHWLLIYDVLLHSRQSSWFIVYLDCQVDDSEI